jgi:hypothetical protein
VSIRNQSRNVERAQDDANFGARVDVFPAYADERVGMSRNNAVGPIAQDPNYHTSLQQGITGLDESDKREEKEDAEKEEGKSNI